MRTYLLSIFIISNWLLALRDGNLVLDLTNVHNGANKRMFVTITAGQDHTCAISAAQETYCWGTNANGQLGIGSADTGQHALPLIIKGQLQFKEMSAGYTHTCAITHDGKAYCWGSNSYGQLGNGSRVSRAAPEKVAGNLQFKSISAGATHTCAVTLDHKAYCWGGNWHGQLGTGSFEGQPDAPCCHTTPVPVRTTLNFTLISAGGIHTCGIAADAHAFCWGNGNDGRLGGGLMDEKDQPLPVPVAGNFKFAMISAWGWQTCGVTISDAAYCWGRGSEGQLGLGQLVTLQRSPAPVAGGVRFSTVRSGPAHTGGLATTGTAYFWGQNNFGQLGIGSTANSAWPSPVSGQLKFRMVVAGGNEFSGHSCGITLDGNAYCWGDNRHGQLGDGTAADKLVPARVKMGPR